MADVSSSFLLYTQSHVIMFLYSVNIHVRSGHSDRLYTRQEPVLAQYSVQ